jgi:hypothetical protein|tara:strand:- start:36 stop:485 length:450 start_codon:yes stop_codon:yes gene_type:complete
MLLGFDSYSATPFSTTGADNGVVVSVSGVPILFKVGNVDITANSIYQIANADPLALKTGTPIITGVANLTVNGSPLAVGSGTVIVSGDADIVATLNSLKIKTGSVTVTGTSNVTPTGSPILVKTGVGSAITWSNIDPNATEVWTPIVPY